MSLLKEKVMEHKKAFIACLIMILILLVNVINCALQGDTYSLIKMTIRLVIIILTVVTFLFAFVFEKTRLDIAALVFTLCFGMISLFIVPLYYVPDEQVHLYAAYMYSSKMMGIKATSDEGTVMMNEGYTLEDYAPEAYIGASLIDYYQRLKVPYTDETVVDSGHFPAASPFYCYIFSSLGITLGRLLHLGAMQIYFLGRLFNLIFYSIGIFFAIKIMPRGKPILFVLSLLPMYIQQAASLSYDAFLVPIAFLTTALTVKYIVENRLLKKEWVLLIVVSAILFDIKGHAYFSIALLPYFVILWRNRKRLIKKDRIRHIVYIIIFALIFLALLLYVRKLRSEPDENYIGVLKGYAYSLPYLAKNPGVTIKVLSDTFLAMGAWYFETFYGGILGRLEIHINSIFVLVYLIIMFLALMHRKGDEYYFSKKAKFGFLAAAFISMMCIMIGMLFGWTMIDSTVIQGVQGRYFIPIAFYIMILFETKSIECSKDMDRHILLYSMWAIGLSQVSMLQTFS